MKNYLITLLCLLSLTTYGQNYKLKKDVLLKDKEPVAKVEGKINLAKTDLTIKTMEDIPFLQVSNGLYKSEIPGTNPLSWFTLHFPQLDKTILLKGNNSYFNTKQFLKKEFEEKGIHFHKNGLQEADLAGLEDYSQQLHADTTELGELIAFFKENLPAHHIQRNLSEPVTFGTFAQSSDIAIIQGKDENGKPLIIGKIMYAHNPGMSSSDPSRQHRVRIFKRLPVPIDHNGEQTEYLIAGYIDLFDSFPELFLYQEGKNLPRLQYAIKQQTDKNSLTAKEAAIFMVKKGYL